MRYESEHYSSTTENPKSLGFRSSWVFILCYFFVFPLFSAVPDYSIVIVGNYLGPTTSSGLRKMDAKYNEHNIMSTSQSLTFYNKGKVAYSSSWNSPQNYGTPLVNGITQCYLLPDRGDLHPNRTGWYSINRPRKDEKMSWPSWLVTSRDGLPVHRRSSILVLTESDVAQLRWSRPTRYH